MSGETFHYYFASLTEFTFKILFENKTGIGLTKE